MFWLFLSFFLFLTNHIVQLVGWKYHTSAAPEAWHTALPNAAQFLRQSSHFSCWSHWSWPVRLLFRESSHRSSHRSPLPPLVRWTQWRNLYMDAWSRPSKAWLQHQQCARVAMGAIDKFAVLHMFKCVLLVRWYSKNENSPSILSFSLAFSLSLPLLTAWCKNADATCCDFFMGPTWSNMVQHGPTTSLACDSMHRYHVLLCYAPTRPFSSGRGLFHALAWLPCPFLGASLHILNYQPFISLDRTLCA